MQRLSDSIETAPDTSQPRCPFLFLIDTSVSMITPTTGGKSRIDEVNAGLTQFTLALQDDPLARLRIEVGIVTFGGLVTSYGDFVPASSFTPPSLTANGGTPMGEAVCLGLDLLQQRRRKIRELGLGLYRPIAVLLTDGQPTDNGTERWTDACRRLRADEAAEKVSSFSIVVGDEDVSMLRELSTRQPARLVGLNFRELFVWLGILSKSISQSRPGDRIVPPQTPFLAPF